MQTYIAHYRSPNAAADRAKGLFEFESASRLGTKANMHDARVRMLELFGSVAVSWSIDKVERKKENAKAEHAHGQLELDFREPKAERKRKNTKEYW